MYDDLIEKQVVVRSSASGVWCGLLCRADGDRVLLRSARRAWQWRGPASCSGLATEGPGSGGRITTPVELAVVGDVCEILLCTPTAITRWRDATEWVSG